MKPLLLTLSAAWLLIVTRGSPAQADIILSGPDSNDGSYSTAALQSDAGANTVNSGGLTGISLWAFLGGANATSPTSPVYGAITTSTQPGMNAKELDPALLPGGDQRVRATIGHFDGRSRSVFLLHAIQSGLSGVSEHRRQPVVATRTRRSRSTRTLADQRHQPCPVVSAGDQWCRRRDKLRLAVRQRQVAPARTSWPPCKTISRRRSSPSVPTPIPVCRSGLSSIPPPPPARTRSSSLRAATAMRSCFRSPRSTLRWAAIRADLLPYADTAGTFSGGNSVACRARPSCRLTMRTGDGSRTAPA